MSKISLKPNANGVGTFTIEAPNSDISKSLVLPDSSGELLTYERFKEENINLGVSVAATGTAVDFVGIPEGVKRITVMLDGVSTNGTSPVQIQFGDSGGIENTGYIANAAIIQTTIVNSTNYTTGFGLAHDSADGISLHGAYTANKLGGNTWALFGSTRQSSIRTAFAAGSKSLSGTLGRIRITTINGTDQFDAGTINISWEF